MNHKNEACVLLNYRSYRQKGFTDHFVHVPSSAGLFSSERCLMTFSIVLHVPHGSTHCFTGGLAPVLNGFRGVAHYFIIALVAVWAKLLTLTCDHLGQSKMDRCLMSPSRCIPWNLVLGSVFAVSLNISSSLLASEN